MDRVLHHDPSVTIFLKPIARPAALGLAGFAGSTWIVASWIAGWWGDMDALLPLRRALGWPGAVHCRAVGLPGTGHARDDCACALGELLDEYGVALVAGGEFLDSALNRKGAANIMREHWDAFSS